MITPLALKRSGDLDFNLGSPHGASGLKIYQSESIIERNRGPESLHCGSWRPTAKAQDPGLQARRRDVWLHCACWESEQPHERSRNIHAELPPSSTFVVDFLHKTHVPGRQSGERMRWSRTYNEHNFAIKPLENMAIFIEHCAAYAGSDPRPPTHCGDWTWMHLEASAAGPAPGVPGPGVVVWLSSPPVEIATVWYLFVVLGRSKKQQADRDCRDQRTYRDLASQRLPTDAMGCEDDDDVAHVLWPDFQTSDPVCLENLSGCQISNQTSAPKRAEEEPSGF
ncbi:hypothetical protein CSOJ01_05519 [Colletotrichum sojae]|uniref:Uncharacterized protein n=1 Tax=Colletotrichum sojae TaxID=2175907 RepID=A0A8H6JFS1_9PEZI|nr:hypothetical protein CSOJ01_05519 [Colletotrichum sojae]